MSSSIVRRGLQISVGLIVACLLLLLGTATAQQRDIPPDRPDSSPSTPSDQNRRTTLQERLNRRKQGLNLSDARRQRLVAGCRPAQAHLGRLSNRVLGFSIRRERLYTSVTSRLANLGRQLQVAEVNTDTLEKQLEELGTKNDEFSAALSEFLLAVEDMAEMDCASDPEGFQASLEEAREARAAVVAAAQSIHEYLQNTVKPTLQDIKQRLAGDSNGTEKNE